MSIYYYLHLPRGAVPESIDPPVEKKGALVTIRGFYLGPRYYQLSLVRLSATRNTTLAGPASAWSKRDHPLQHSSGRLPRRVIFSLWRGDAVRTGAPKRGTEG